MAGRSRRPRRQRKQPEIVDWPKFPHAPIREAILDIRADLPPGVTLEILARAHEAIRDRYPQRKERVKFQGGFGFAQGGVEVMPAMAGPDGYLFTSIDGRQIVQTRLDGFTFNRLEPYDRWEAFRNEGREHWARYVDLVRPIRVTRLALRYINRIEIPVPIKDFKSYILTAPDIAPKLPQQLQTFFMRLEIPDEARHCMAIITETIEPPAQGRLPLIFDIDAVREGAFSPEGAEIWRIFEELRDYKNEVFFNSMTNRAKRLFA
jgi:uncharacterized protein (TIGR04255 family)